MLQAEEPIALEGVTVGSGQEFLGWLARYLQASVGMQFAFVGEIAGTSWERIHTMFVCRAGQAVDNFEYDLRGTPCANVLRQDTCIHPSGVAALYPDDKLLAALGIESYVGVSLFGTNEAPLGLMVLLDDKTISEEKIALAVATLDLFRSRAEAELSFRAALRTMELAVAGTAEATLDVLVASLARAMNVRGVFVAEPVADEHGKARTVSLCLDAEILADAKYDIADSPCADVYERGSVLIGQGARTRWYGGPWPHGDFLATIDVDAYAGVLVRSANARPIGHIALVHDKPLPDAILEDQLFRLYRSRITSELHRRETEAKRAEMDRVLMETQRRQSLGVLAGGIAHDFNNLLVSVVGHTDVLLRDHPSGKTRDDLETILGASKRAAQLCQQLLAYAGKHTSTPEIVDINTLLLEIERLTGLFASPQCKYVSQLSPTPVRVKADVVQLQQVAMNLTKNAADAIGDDTGIIVLETGIEQCERSRFTDALVGSNLPAGRYAYLGVSDNGPGMEPFVLKRIFDPFYSTKQDGHGLGLAAVLGIVESQGGALLVASERGWGTRFRIYLPLAEQIAHVTQAPPSTSEEPRPLTPGSILHIDDEPLVLRATKAILDQAGIDSISATNGPDGIELFRKHQESIRCVILDLSMPEMGGAKVLVALREIAPDVRVLIASGYPEIEALSKLSEKPNGLIMKPFGVDQLVAKLASITETASQRRPSFPSVGPCGAKHPQTG